MRKFAEIIDEDEIGAKQGGVDVSADLPEHEYDFGIRGVDSIGFAPFDNAGDVQKQGVASGNSVALFWQLRSEAAPMSFQRVSIAHIPSAPKFPAL